MKTSQLFILFLFTFLLPVTASAITVKFTFTTTVTQNFGDTPGVTDGDTLTLVVMANNGGTDLVNEDWFLTDITSSAVASVGSYEAVFNFPHTNATPIFSTNGSENLDNANLTDLDSNNTDNLGSGSPSLFGNTLLTSQGANLDFTGGEASDGTNWTVEFAPVPVPAAIWLFASGLLGLVGISRRKKA